MQAVSYRPIATAIKMTSKGGGILLIVVLMVALAAIRGQQTKQRAKYVHFTDHSMAVVVRRYYTGHIIRWRRSMAFIKATKRHHRASTLSNSINQTCLPLLQRYISSPKIVVRELELP